MLIKQPPWETKKAPTGNVLLHSLDKTEKSGIASLVNRRGKKPSGEIRAVTVTVTVPAVSTDHTKSKLIAELTDHPW